MKYAFCCLFAGKYKFIPNWRDGSVCLGGRYCLWLTLNCMKVKMLVSQSCPTLGNPMDLRRRGPLGSSVYGIHQARILEWVAIPFFRGSSQSRDRTQVSCIAGRFFTIWATREVPRTGKESGVTEIWRPLPSKPKELYGSSGWLTPECLFSTTVFWTCHHVRPL